MITENELKNVFASMIPSFGAISGDYNDLNKLINRFTNYTEEVIIDNNLRVVLECFITADFLLKDGNDNIKNAIGNIYVFSLAMFLEVTDSVYSQIKEILPVTLREEYKRQLNSKYFL